MALTDTEIRGFAPDGRTHRYYDTGGLYLELTPTGSKLWRMKYRRKVGDKLTETRLALGAYPEVGLRKARELRDEARAKIRQGIDPIDDRRAAAAGKHAKTDNTFERIARQWHAERARSKWVAGHATRVLQSLERDIIPWIGGKDITDIEPAHALEVARRVRDRGAAETASRVLSIISQVCRFAVIIGRLRSDPCRDLRGAMEPPPAEHFPAPTDPAKVGELLRALWGYHGSPITRAALRLGPLVFVRPGELRQAEWAAIDLNAGEWRFKLSKGGGDHIVPLSHQAVAVLAELHALTGDCRWAFPSVRTIDRPMSNNAVLAALRRLGIDKAELVGHSWRAVARTMLDERLGFEVHLIEHQLGHTVADPLGRAYNRTTHLDQRRIMMQRWADYLDDLRAGLPATPHPGADGPGA